jgi:hypothetical protein
MEVPNLLLQKFPAPEFVATTHVKVSAKAAGQQSGLIVMGLDYSRLAIEYDGKNFEIKHILCKDADRGNAEESEHIANVKPDKSYGAGLTPIQELNIVLRVIVENGGKCRFSYSLDGKKFKECPTPFQARQGKWIGAKVGLFSVQRNGTERGWLDVDSFEISAIQPS